MIGNNSCGMHAQFAGKTEENTLELEILTYDGVRMTVGETSEAQVEAYCARTDRIGAIYRELRALRDRSAATIRATFPQIPRRVSGYALDELLPEKNFNVARSLVGTECTCVLVLSAKLKLIPNPAKRAICVLGFDDVYAAGDAVPAINALQPIALEGLDQKLIDFMDVKHLESQNVGLLPKGHGWLMVEFGSVDDHQAAIDAAHDCAGRAKELGATGARVITDEHEQQRLWEVREAGLGATAKIPNERPFHPGWEDSAVPPDKVGPYLRDLRALYDKYGYDAALYGHFGNGCIHCRVNFVLDDADGVAAWRRFLHEAAHLVTSYGGSLSGEHGDGQARGELLPIMYGQETYEAFREFKRIWDPEGRMNPGKVVDAYPATSNLREGPYYRPPEPQTRFSFQHDDRGSFAYAANRCVGVGECRRHDGKKTMCPSYRVTKEEMHSTRGRARLLFEMLEGEPLRAGWRSEAVKEALDLCLACKGCKGDCPVNVDMATYKAEFLSHYYEGRRRPVWAYAFGLIPWWAHLAANLPRAVNALAQAPLLGAAGKALAKVAPQRQIPLFAEESFKDWYRRHRAVRPNVGKPRVILWPDTFNAYFHADTARHALEVLEAAGYDAIVPLENVCCGRPLYDYGMLDLARVLLRELLEVLRPEIEAGTPVVVLEPSCASVFKDELLNMLPHDHDAQRLADQVATFGTFLQRDERWEPPQLHRRVVLHGHCHHKSVAALAMDDDHAVLRKLGAQVQQLDDGCCGMAGAFGFEAGEHYDVSVKCGELAYLPAMREAAHDDIIVGDGFSCREQAMQLTDRQPLHLADVVWLALAYGPEGPPGSRPELSAMPDVAAGRRRARRDALRGALALAGLLAATAAACAAFAVRGGRR